MRSVTCYILNGQYIDMVTGKVKLNLTEVDGSQCNNETKPQESIMGCNDFKCLFEWRAARQFGEVSIVFNGRTIATYILLLPQYLDLTIATYILLLPQYQ